MLTCKPFKKLRQWGERQIESSQKLARSLQGFPRDSLSGTALSGSANDQREPGTCCSWTTSSGYFRWTSGASADLFSLNFWFFQCFFCFCPCSPLFPLSSPLSLSRTLRVYVQVFRVSIENVPLCTSNTSTCIETRERGAGTHGDVLNRHTTTTTTTTHTSAHNNTQHATQQQHHTTPQTVSRFFLIVFLYCFSLCCFFFLFLCFELRILFFFSFHVEIIFQFLTNFHVLSCFFLFSFLFQFLSFPFLSLPYFLDCFPLSFFNLFQKNIHSCFSFQVFHSLFSQSSSLC